MKVSRYKLQAPKDLEATQDSRAVWLGFTEATRARDLAEPPGHVSWPVASPDPYGGPRGHVSRRVVTVSDVYHVFELGLLISIVLAEPSCTTGLLLAWGQSCGASGVLCGSMGMYAEAH